MHEGAATAAYKPKRRLLDGCSCLWLEIFKMLVLLLAVDVNFQSSLTSRVTLVRLVY
jgi:hypothetical protein